MSPTIPEAVQLMLRQASDITTGQSFSCGIFAPEWNEFVELWAPKIHAFVSNALGPYDTNPRSDIRHLTDGFHIAGATASFDPSTGQIRLASSVEGNAGQTLEKLTHEMTHGSLAKFPEGDPFYEEGFVDYSVWVMAHAPCWEPYRADMIKAAGDNIRNRRERALKTGTDYDRKRWAGGLFAATAFGPYVVAMLRQKKQAGDYTW
jgi:hypothetical protein